MKVGEILSNGAILLDDIGNYDIIIRIVINAKEVKLVKLGWPMRLIPTKKLKEGDIIARDIISYDGGLLLREDTRFRNVFKQKLLERNIFEVYIDDEISKGIEPIQVIEPQIGRAHV